MRPGGNGNWKARMPGLLLSLLLLLAGCGEATPLTAYERGMAALQSGDWNSALSFFETSTKTEGQEALGYRGEGLVYLERDQYDLAARAFQSALDAVERPQLNRPFADDVRLYLANVYVLQGKPEQALTVYSQLLDSERAGEAYLLRGKLYAADGKFGQAGQDFQRAVEIDPSFEIYLQIYDVYAGLNRQADGAVFLREAQAHSTGSEEDAYQMGRINYFLGDYDAAKEELTKAMNGEVPGAAALLGRVFLEEGDVSGARTIYQACIDRGIDPASGHNGLALCHMETGEYQMALQQIHEGLQNADKTTAEHLLFNEIIIYERQKEFETALEKMESFLSTYPGNAEAQKEYLFLKSRIEEIQSVAEDVSGKVWAQIMKDWEEAEPQTEEAPADTPAEETPTEEAPEEEAYPKVDFSDLEEPVEEEAPAGDWEYEETESEG